MSLLVGLRFLTNTELMVRVECDAMTRWVGPGVGTAPSPSRDEARDPLALPNSHLPLLVDRFKPVVINQLSHFHQGVEGG